MTRLLVSVRSAEEARDALAGGADLIDLKEPTQGWRACRGGGLPPPSYRMMDSSISSVSKLPFQPPNLPTLLAKCTDRQGGTSSEEAEKT